jgi:hypothetical protein
MAFAVTELSKLKVGGLSVAICFVALISAIRLAGGQNQQVDEKLTTVKQSIAANKQALAQYTWQEQETISIKGEVKDTKTIGFQWV